MSNSGIDVFADAWTALVWMVGRRAISRTPNPTNMRSMRCTLVQDGHAVLLHADSNQGRISCVAELPYQMTEAELGTFEWLGMSGDDGLRAMNPAGNA